MVKKHLVIDFSQMGEKQLIEIDLRPMKGKEVALETIMERGDEDDPLPRLNILTVESSPEQFEVVISFSGQLSRLEVIMQMMAVALPAGLSQYTTEDQHGC